MRGFLVSMLLLCGTFLFASPALNSASVEPPATADCSSFVSFLENEEMLLSYTASLGESCVTIETTLFFDDAGMATEKDADGNALWDFGYQVMESSGQCVLASTGSGCGVQVLSFNNDNTALTLTADGEDASLTPVAENTDNWGIFQTYAILNEGSSDAYYAGGANPDNIHPAFGGVDLGNFSSSETLTLNGGEIKTYKNNAANVCGGNIQYRVYLDGATPGSFSAIALGFSADLGSGDQKWSTTDAGIDLLGGLTLGDYTLEVYWDADGDTNGGCGYTNTENNSGANYSASFSLVSYGCTDAAACNYDASATADDSSCESLSCAGCTDSNYAEYDAAATIDDGSCLTTDIYNETANSYHLTIAEAI
ncbi:MAG: hypothetical protein L7S67_05755, partial [Flavobacteriales bacterium]|nr:hypothetical protein [Flavobacteriales bacterium]